MRLRPFTPSGSQYSINDTMPESTTDLHAWPQPLLSHISFAVSSYENSKKFYDAVLATIDAVCVYQNSEKRALGYGPASNPHLEVLDLFEEKTAVNPSGPGVHFALNAPNRKAVRAFWEVAMENGGTDEGKWGLRPHYGENYYAAFVRDPDGYKLEVVFQGKEEADTL